ncbi:YopX family protein [Rhodococcus sp. CH91]|uniref:YopX family protein n=1 Tax=Rhodococcus sp. CH91 TaxID=2910256 RepID=UPI0035A90CDD
MIREIKFRGLSRVRGTRNKTEMVYGQLDMKPNKDARIIWYGTVRTGRKVRRSIFVDYRTVGQFTGLSDAHNNELYEGDICWNPHDETWGEVIWDEGGWCYQWENVIESLHDCCDFVEVRGNVHEHPELLNQG